MPRSTVDTTGVTDAHLRRLERVYHAAPSNSLTPATMTIEPGAARTLMRIEPSYRQAVGGVHGMFIFKLLDETAFYAANSLVDDVFLTTANMTTSFAGPVMGETVVATAHVVHAGRSSIIAVADVANEDGTLVAHATGTFVRTREPLPPITA